jgi:hypothetical protein
MALATLGRPDGIDVCEKNPSALKITNAAAAGG